MVEDGFRYNTKCCAKAVVDIQTAAKTEIRKRLITHLPAMVLPAQMKRLATKVTVGSSLFILGVPIGR